MLDLLAICYLSPRVQLRHKLQEVRSSETAHRWQAVQGHRLVTAWHVSAIAGMRRGEVLGFRWKDVDFDNTSISVRQALVSVAYEVVASTPKNHHARVIDLDEGTVNQLRAHRKRQHVDRDEWGTDYQHRELVFCKEDGSPIHPHAFSQAFERLVTKMSIPTIRLHDLRHTHATISLKEGIPVKVIRERLGHENPAFTMKQYAHVIPGMQAEAAQIVAKLIGVVSAEAQGGR